MRKFKLKKDILEFRAGYIVNCDGENGKLGWGNFGWDIPIFIMERNLEWFEEVFEDPVRNIPDCKHRATYEKEGIEYCIVCNQKI